MKIQDRKVVHHDAKHSYNSHYTDCSSLLEELEIKEIEACENDDYWQAFIIQFSFLEQKLESSVLRFAKILDVDESSYIAITIEDRVSQKITYFSVVLASFISEESKNNFKELIQRLRIYNTFRNDLLHDCSNEKKFKGALHLDRSVQEAYLEGVDILKLMARIQIKK